MTIIELIKVSKNYPNSKLPAICDVSLKVEEGEVLALLGPSGSGKTTLLRLIAGFETPDEGVVLLKGNIVSEQGLALPPEKRGVGMVFQDYALFPHLNAAENIAFGLRRMSRSEKNEKVCTILEMVGLSDFSKRYPHELSGGQQQRIALARALAPDPALVLLDEPFSSLDPDMCVRMREDVSEILQKTGSTAVLVTHDHEEAFSMADKVALLNEGRLEQLDTPEGIYHTPLSPFVADFVGKADFITGVVEGGKIVTEIGCLQNTSHFIEGAEVMVMIRPDDIDLRPNAKGDATVLERQFRGSENYYRLRLSSGQIIHSGQHSVSVYPVGSQVDLQLQITHVVAFEKTKVNGPRS
ncbi:MAG: ABC transporter ATP-binding protein [Nitrospirae bacterium]|nr:ABC transporter ATP-binding protein [Candidatus Manganitrophaceae bacterium]